MCTAEIDNCFELYVKNLPIWIEFGIKWEKYAVSAEEIARQRNSSKDSTEIHTLSNRKSHRWARCYRN
jgi:hypothetical protein